MDEDKITGIAELKKAMCDECSFGLNAKRCKDNKQCLFIRLTSEFEAWQQKPIERGKQSLEFLKWLMREIEAEYPKAEISLKNLETAKKDIEAFVNLEDDKKILEGEGGEKEKG